MGWNERHGAGGRQGRGLCIALFGGTVWFCQLTTPAAVTCHADIVLPDTRSYLPNASSDSLQQRMFYMGARYCIGVTVVVGSGNSLARQRCQGGAGSCNLVSLAEDTRGEVRSGGGEKAQDDT